MTGTLETIVERARETGVEPPAVTVVGDVVSVRERVHDYLGGAPPAPAAGERAERETPVSTE